MVKSSNKGKREDCPTFQKGDPTSSSISFKIFDF